MFWTSFILSVTAIPLRQIQAYLFHTHVVLTVQVFTIILRGLTKHLPGALWINIRAALKSKTADSPCSHEDQVDACACLSKNLSKGKERLAFWPMMHQNLQEIPENGFLTGI